MNVGVGSGHGQGYAQLAACSALYRETGMARFLGLLTHELDDFEHNYQIIIVVGKFTSYLHPPFGNMDSYSSEALPPKENHRLEMELSSRSGAGSGKKVQVEQDLTRALRRKHCQSSACVW